MHELAVCQALLDQVHQIAAEHDHASVTKITVAVGPLSGIVPELLERAFSLARASGPASKAELVLETPAARIRCRICGAESEVPPSKLICLKCGDFHTELLTGDELILKSIEMVESGNTPDRQRAGEQPCATHADAM